MGQLFSQGADTLFRLTFLVALLLIIGTIWLGYEVGDSDYKTGVNSFQEQPIPFSHEHHVGGLGLDCRYCHQFVEKTAYAGMPTVETCMHCHKYIWTNARILGPLRNAYEKGEAIHWRRIYDLPDFVYFNHSIHLAKGVGCYSCHGNVALMPMMMKAYALDMIWCLNCHRNPVDAMRPQEALTSMEGSDSWSREEKQILMEANHVQAKTDCYACHR